MLTLNFQNSAGNMLPLINNEWFDLTNVDAQTSMHSSISSSVVGGMDGDTVTNVQADPRSIVLDLQIKSGKNVELAKREILKYFKAKQKGTLVWTQENKTKEITGLVEVIEMPRWTDSVVLQITLHCEQPFWQDIDYVVQLISEAINVHYFTDYSNDMLFFPEDGIVLGEYDVTRTRTFINNGDVSVGLIITVTAVATVTNPIIYDSYGHYFGVGYGEGVKQLVLEAGDVVVITTEKGKKSVTLNGINIISKVKPNSTWLQLGTGEQQFSINSDDENINNMFFTLEYKQRYV